MHPDDDVLSSLEAFAHVVEDNVGGEAAARYAEEEARREQDARASQEAPR